MNNRIKYEFKEIGEGEIASGCIHYAIPAWDIQEEDINDMTEAHEIRGFQTEAGFTTAENSINLKLRQIQGRIESGEFEVTNRQV